MKMKKKILIANFFAAIIILTSFTVVAGNTDNYTQRARSNLLSTSLGDIEPNSIPPNIEKYASLLWNKTIQPFLLMITSYDWPKWRQNDNDTYDHDGPSKADENDMSKYDDPDNLVKYNYLGLDDCRDWDCLGAFIFSLSISSVALILSIFLLIVIVGILGLPGVILGIITSSQLYLEAFDFEDLPYQQWNSGYDGL
jgi:hypothetical protein